MPTRILRLAAVIAGTAITTCSLAQSATTICGPASVSQLQITPPAKRIVEPSVDVQQQARDLLDGAASRRVRTTLESPRTSVSELRVRPLDPQEQAQRLILGPASLPQDPGTRASRAHPASNPADRRTTPDAQELARRMISGVGVAGTPIQTHSEATAIENARSVKLNCFSRSSGH
jgi:hypothetical protein